MEDMQKLFSMKEIKSQLDSLGYSNIAKEKLDRFCNDLNVLAKHERSRNSFLSNSTNTTNSFDVDASNPVGSREVSHHVGSGSSQGNEITLTEQLLPNETVNKENFSYYSKDLHSNTGDEQYRHRPIVTRTPVTGKAILKRKVLRKHNGESYVYDESVTESETDSIANDSSTHTGFTAGNANRDPKKLTNRENFRLQNDHSNSVMDELYQHQWAANNVLPSFIRASTSHPHTRNLKKADPVAKYHKYATEWRNRGIPGQNNNSALRWHIREQLIQQQEPPRPKSQHSYIPNNYVIPTDKKRKALRWEVRTNMA